MRATRAKAFAKIRAQIRVIMLELPQSNSRVIVDRRAFSKSADELPGEFRVAHCGSEGFGDVGGAGESVDADGQVADCGQDVCGVDGTDLGAVFIEGDVAPQQSKPSAAGSRCSSALGCSRPTVLGWLDLPVAR